MDKNVTIIREPEGRKIVLINDIRFKGKTKEEWKEIENYLKEYIGEYSEIAENKSVSADFKAKHGNKAKYGWYRYDTRLALPVYNDCGEIQKKKRVDRFIKNCTVVKPIS